MIELFCCMLCYRVFYWVTAFAHLICISVYINVSCTVMTTEFWPSVLDTCFHLFWKCFRLNITRVQSFKSCVIANIVKPILYSDSQYTPLFVPMHPRHSYLSGSYRLDWSGECFTTNLLPQDLSRFLVKFDEFYLGRWFLINISHYFIEWSHAKSTGIHGGAHPRL